jgi:hypothetical protein
MSEQAVAVVAVVVAVAWMKRSEIRGTLHEGHSRIALSLMRATGRGVYHCGLY